MSSSIICRCHHCKALMRAPVQLVGRSVACPGCGTSFVVVPPTPADAAPSLLACGYRLAAGGGWPTRRHVER